jgi:hypothetical protein
VALGRRRLLRFGFGGGFAPFFAGHAAFAFLFFVVLFAHIVLLYFAEIMPFVWRVMMKMRRIPFNIYLLVLAALLAGCQSPDSKPPAESGKKKPSGKEGSTLRFHYVINPDGTERCLPITVYRANPMTFHIDRTPFLWEVSVTRASVVTNLGSYGLRVEFDRPGAITLDTFSTLYKSHHIAIYSDFGQSRWLAAPIITRRITNGVFEFTPDASREETERIARGLNNLAKKNKPPFAEKKKTP